MITYIWQLVDTKDVILLLRMGHFEIKLIQMRSYLLVSGNDTFSFLGKKKITGAKRKKMAETKGEREEEVLKIFIV